MNKESLNFQLKKENISCLINKINKQNINQLLIEYAKLIPIIIHILQN